MHIPLFHIDAFTNQPFRGNPAAVCLLDFWLDDGSLRKVAAENNLPATAFLVRSADGYELRWFTGIGELRLCGHATLAAAYVVLDCFERRLQTAHFQTRFHGTVTVWRGEDGFLVGFPSFVAKDCAKMPEILSGLRLEVDEACEFLEGNDTKVVVLDSHSKVQKVCPDSASLTKLHPSAVLVTARGKDSDFVCRYFAPSYGIPEDQVTGSAQCLLAPYWAKRLGKSHLQARQLSERGGEIWCELKGDRVILRGSAVLTMRGTLEL